MPHDVAVDTFVIVTTLYWLAILRVLKGAKMKFLRNEPVGGIVDQPQTKPKTAQALIRTFFICRKNPGG